MVDDRIDRLFEIVNHLAQQLEGPNGLSNQIRDFQRRVDSHDGSIGALHELDRQQGNEISALQFAVSALVDGLAFAGDRIDNLQGGVPGPAGAAGPAGPRGLGGLDGPDGSRGPPGPAGASGAVGPAGPATGVPGPTGARGERGAGGERGAQGTRGPAGLLGPAGDTGPPGGSGPAGGSGSIGPRGAQGDPGVIGPRGEPGPATGVPGERGERGERGEMGAQGAPGEAGAAMTGDALVETLEAQDGAPVGLFRNPLDWLARTLLDLSTGVLEALFRRMLNATIRRD